MASKRHIRKNMCTGKIRYYDKDSAQMAVWKAIKRYKHSFVFYRCQFGDHYHIGKHLQHNKGTFGGDAHV